MDQQQWDADDCQPGLSLALLRSIRVVVVVVIIVVVVVDLGVNNPQAWASVNAGLDNKN